jgi:hypothetical protein
VLYFTREKDLCFTKNKLPPIAPVKTSPYFCCSIYKKAHEAFYHPYQPVSMQRMLLLLLYGQIKCSDEVLFFPAFFSGKSLFGARVRKGIFILAEILEKEKCHFFIK